MDKLMEVIDILVEEGVVGYNQGNYRVSLLRISPRR